LIAIASCTVGVLALSAAVSKWLFTTLSRLGQGMLFVGGILLIYPEWITSLIGVCLIAPVVRINYQKKANTSKLAAAVENAAPVS